MIVNPGMSAENKNGGAPCYYGTCTDTGDTVEKTVQCPGFKLVTGARVLVKFSFANYANEPTLNVENSGAIPIVVRGTIRGRVGIWGFQRMAEFVYDGDNWCMCLPSFIEGNGSADGDYSHSEGNATKSSGLCSHAEGQATEASGEKSHAEGWATQASGACSHAEGFSTVARGNYSSACGQGTVANVCQLVAGSYNVEFGTYNTSDAQVSRFIVGKGSPIERSNCFRVTSIGVYATGAHNTTGADYAELFEWLDGNPDKADRCGRFVTLDGEKIRLAGPADNFILGIVSGNPSVVGDVHDDQWQGMYLYDIFGCPLWEDVEVPDVTMELPDPEDPEKTITQIVIPAHIEHRQKLNPDYDGSQPYRPRTQRPEWDAVGMLGKLVAVDDGTCQVNGWCTVGEGGAATHSAQRTRYRVMARLDETHVRVLML